MKVLIAEDEAVSRRVLQATLERAGYHVVAAANGDEAWAAFQQGDPPRLAILDWMMPGMDGVQIISRVRQEGPDGYCYLVLLTSRGDRADIVEGLEAGADEYLTKPFDPSELLARVKVGERILALESALAAKVHELEEALAHVKTLQGLLPICMFCKKIRDDRDTWHRLEAYLEKHSGASFTHALCRECRREHYPEVPERRRA